MAPTATIPTENSEIAYILGVLTKQELIKISWKDIASEYGISQSSNASRKFRESLKKFGFTFEGNRITKLEENGEGINATPKKAGPKKAEGKATPKTKKRKLCEEDRNQEEKEITGGGLEDAKDEGGEEA